MFRRSISEYFWLFLWINVWKEYFGINIGKEYFGIDIWKEYFGINVCKNSISEKEERTCCLSGLLGKVCFRGKCQTICFPIWIIHAPRLPRFVFLQTFVFLFVFLFVFVFELFMPETAEICILTIGDHCYVCP